MKYIYLLATMVFLASCSQEPLYSEKTNQVAVKNCTTQQWDTILVPINAKLGIDNYKTAVPELKMIPNNTNFGVFKTVALNICEFKIIN
jgi:hypothetical protein